MNAEIQKRDVGRMEEERKGAVEEWWAGAWTTGGFEGQKGGVTPLQGHFEGRSAGKHGKAGGEGRRDEAEASREGKRDGT